MKEYIIIMADIIGSREKDQQQLMLDFRSLIEELNLNNSFVSPLTITLGDEFQGVLASINQAVDMVIKLEEALVRGNKGFKLRYVVVEGLIETPINAEIAYGMLGDGLTRARTYLNNLKKDDSRFFFWFKNQQQKNALNNLFTALQELWDEWKASDHQLITSFLTLGDYKRVAEELGKDSSLMWRRKKSLKINTYIALKEVANYIAHE